jgi:hypothetical protein
MNIILSPFTFPRKRRFCITPLTSNHGSPPDLIPVTKRTHRIRSKDRIIKFAIAAASSGEFSGSELEGNTETKVCDKSPRNACHPVANRSPQGPSQNQCNEWELLNEYCALMFEWICDESEPSNGSRKSYRISLKQSLYSPSLPRYLVW